MSEEKKPEEAAKGFVLWSEEFGFTTINDRFFATPSQECIRVYLNEGGANASWPIKPAGARVRPVKVVFTDEEGEK